MTPSRPPRARAGETGPVTVITEGEVRRRQAARSLAMPLSASWADIEAEQVKRGRPVVRGFAVLTEAELDGDALEKAEQTEIVRLTRAFGGKVYNLSQARRTKQTPGLPDLWLVFPRVRRALWWETKRTKGGRFSSAQLDFADECRTCGVEHASGDRHAFTDWLIAAGICAREPDGTLTPLAP